MNRFNLRSKDFSGRRKTAARRSRFAAMWAESLEPRTLLSVNSFDFSRGFTGNGIQFNGGAAYAASAISLADTSTPNEARSAFYATPVAITSFTSDFTFQMTNAANGGFTFSIQGVGPSALGGSGAGLGYAGISSSAAIAFNVANGVAETGLSLNGVVSTPTFLTAGSINILSGDLITVHLSYSGSTLLVSETDAQTAASASQTYSVNLASAAGAANGFIGFTAGTATGGMNLTLDGWDYSDTTGTPGLGIDINAPGDDDSDDLFADAMKTASPWGSVAKPWDQTAPVDANGWPTTDAGVVIATGTGANVNGTYALSFTGQAASVYGVACSATMENKVYNAATNTTTAQIVVQGSDQVMLAFTGTRRLPTDTTATGITNVQLFRPSSPGANASLPPTAIFDPPILNEIERFSVIRFMNFSGTDNSEDVNWSDRVLPSERQSTGDGGAWEYAVELCNTTNTDLWINIPGAATNAYITDLANLIKYGSDGVNPYTSPQTNPVFPPLNPNLHVYLEYSNETWDTLFPQNKQNLDAALAEVAAGNSPLNYDGTTSDFILEERRNANQTVNISNIFRGVFGDSQMMSRIRPIDAWQYNNVNNTAQIQLDFLNNYYDNADGQQHVADPHPVDYYIWGGSGGWYGWVDNASITGAVTVADSGFETPAVTNFQADPTGTPWTFAGTAGIAANGSTLGNPAAAAGTQAAYIQGTGSITQTITFPSGYADLTFSLAQGTAAGESVDVLVNGVQIGGDFTPGASGYSNKVTLAFNGGAPAGAYTVEFVGKGSGAVFIDNVGSQSAADIYNSGIGYVTRNITVEANWSLAYGLHETGYEGGFTFGDANPDDLQIQANFDSRAEAAQLNTLDQFFENGGELGIFYTSSGDNANGLTTDPSNLDSPKFLGIDDLEASGLPPLIYGTLLPTVAGQSVAIAEPVNPIGPGTSNQEIYMLRATAPGTYTVTLSGTQSDPNATEHFMLDGVLLAGLTSLPTGATAGTSSPSITFTIPTAGLHALSLFIDGPNQINPAGGSLTITAVVPPTPALPAAPAAVRGLTASPGAVGQINLNWLAAAGAVSYRIERSTNGTNFTIVGGASGSSLSFTDSTASPGVAYSYQVQAINSGGAGPASSAVQVTAPPVTLAAPWTDADINSPNIAGFGDYNSATGVWTVGGTTTPPNPTAGVLPPATRDQLNFLSAWINNTTFSAQVEIKSVSDAGGSAGLMARDSTAAGAAMAAVVYSPSAGVSFLTRSADNAAAIATTPIAVTGPVWVSLSRSGTSFSAFYSTDGIHWLQVGVATTVAMPTLSLVGLSASSDDGYIRNIATFANLSATPAAPASLTATVGAKGVVNLAWNAVAGATSYNVYRSTKAGAEYTLELATGVTSAAYTDSSAAANVNYYYEVTAVNSQGESFASNEAASIPTSAGATRLAFMQQPTGGQAGAGIGAVAVAVEGATGNTIATDSSAVTLTLQGGTFANGSPIATVQAVSGVATFGNLIIDAAGAYTLTASDGALTGASSAAFSVVAAASAKLVFVQQPTQTAAGANISPAVTVAVQDSFGNVVLTDASVVTLTLAGGVFANGAAAATADVVHGIAAFATLAIDAGGSGYTLTASDAGLKTAASNAFAITSTVSTTAAKLAFVQQPSSAVAGVAINPAVTVAVETSGSAVVTTDASFVTLTLAGGQFAGGGNTVTVQAAAGVARFSGLIIDATGASYSLTATDSTLASAMSNSFGITPAPSAKLAFLQSPASASAGQNITPAITVAVEDSFGNRVTTDGSTITLTLSSGVFASGTASATAIASGGVATFSGLVIDAVGTYQITAKDSALASATSGSFKVAAAAAAKLIFDQQPASATAGSAIGPAVTVAVEDAAGNVVTTDGSTVTLTLSSGAFASGTASVTAIASGGVATFSGLVIDAVGTYQITAKDSALASATSGSFKVAAAAAAKLVFDQQPTSETAGAAITPAITVAVEDTYGNLVGSDASTVTLTLSAGVLATAKTSVAAAASAGVATFSGVAIDAAGSYTLKATDGVLVSAVSSAFQVKPGAVSLSQSAVSVASASIAVGVATTITLQTRDAFGNPLTTGGLAVAFSLSGTGTSAGTLSAVTDHGNGVYTAVFTATAAGTARQISAKIGGLPVTSAMPSIAVTAPSDGAITPKGAIFHAIQGRTATAIVATFSVTNAAAPLSHFTATVTWGDGQSSAGTIVSNGNGAFTVNGSHAYRTLSTGKGFPITVTIKDVSGTSASIASLGQVIAAALSANAAPTLSATLASGVVSKTIATFNDDNPLATSANYTGTIAWGDGAQSTAVFQLLSTTAEVKTVWGIVGSHKYVKTGAYAVVVTVHEPAANLTLTVKLTIDVT